MKFDVVIIGGGAAGLFCAIQAGKRGRKTLVLEHNSQLGRKILISGGGRCNFTNNEVSANNFISQNPHFCKSALAGYTSHDFIDLVKSHKIPYFEKKLGQLFCRENSGQIVDMLWAECQKANVSIKLNCSISNISKENKFKVQTNQGCFESENLVIATGGLSFPKIGATGFGFKIARQFGLKIVETRPSLVPLIFAKENFSKLAGISIDTLVSTGKRGFRENILFTHRGLSGPAILQISNYWQKEKSVKIDLFPEGNILDILLSNKESKQNLDNIISRYLPHRFVENFVQSKKTLTQTSKKELEQIAERLHNWQFYFNETEGYQKAEVTLGGIDTNELSSQTMESKNVKGLFFIGEIVDVTGWLGGYNFQWAWSSGYACGQHI